MVGSRVLGGASAITVRSCDPTLHHYTASLWTEVNATRHDGIGLEGTIDVERDTCTKEDMFSEVTNVID